MAITTNFGTNFAHMWLHACDAMKIIRLFTDNFEGNNHFHQVAIPSFDTHYCSSTSHAYIKYLPFKVYCVSWSEIPVLLQPHCNCSIRENHNRNPLRTLKCCPWALKMTIVIMAVGLSPYMELFFLSNRPDSNW